jgi:hypothetical protein
MDGSNVQFWGLIAQLGVAFVTLVGILISMYYSSQALQEVRRDRELRYRPYLAFEPGGHRRMIDFVEAGRAIPGVNPAYTEQVLSHVPEDIESVRLVSPSANGEDGSEDDESYRNPAFYGSLINLGAGPALSTEVVWVAESVGIGSDVFEIDESKRSEPVYREELNKMPSSPSHIAPEKKASLSRIPTFIEKDFEKKITEVSGHIKIRYKDTIGNEYETKQDFWIMTGYDQDPPFFHVTFRDIIDEES